MIVVELLYMSYIVNIASPTLDGRQLCYEWNCGP